jgi:cytochrome c oxidase assembly protein subunit 15
MGIALASVCLIVFTGALVRLTGSGLGCTDWPRCNETKFVDVSTGHTMIEQVNRLFTGVVSASVIAAVLLSYLRKPRRADLVKLSWGLIIGVLAQVVIGGIVVLTGLNPFANMTHFLVSIILVTNAFVLYRRSTNHPPATYIRRLAPGGSSLLMMLAVISATAVVTGTVVTATGPHAGDENAVRFGFALTNVARLHGLAVILTVAFIVYLAVKAKRWADKKFMDAIQTLLIVSCFQAAIGYTQYFTGVPVILVAAHIIGAVSFWLAICHVLFEESSA